MEIINTTGRRKASVARVYMTKGTGKFVINGKVYTDYFPTENIQYNITDPFKTVEAVNEFDVKANVTGGGFKGQAEAVRMAISRALVIVNEDYRKSLKDKQYLRRDARVVERKKYGKPKARKSFQFSKR